MNIADTVAPKSNQLNADDLIAGPRTITITRVSGTGNGDQPVAVSFEGDEGKPFLPCKSMRRVMIAVWGADASQYVGRSMMLYRDPKVVFGGMEVGGIRISHMSHMEREMVMALTVTKAKRAPYTVKPLRQEAPPPPAEPRWKIQADALLAKIAGVQSAAELLAITDAEDTKKLRDWLAQKQQATAKAIEEAVGAAYQKHVTPPADDAGDDIP